MSRRVSTLWLLGLGLLFAGMLAELFALRVRRDAYPVYSSLRTDALGLRALHDALAELSGVAVTRWREPLVRLPATPARTIVVAGGPAAGLADEEARALAAAAAAGSRVVLALRAPGDEEVPTEADEPGPLGFAVGARPVVGEAAADGARRAEAAPAGWPEQLAWWTSPGYLRLEAAAAWRIIYRRGGRPVLAERPWGRGSVVVATDSFFLSNEAMQRERETALLWAVLAPAGRVEFVESHLGVRADPGVAALARRYGLEGAAGVLAILAGLWAWRRLALFVPPAPEPAVMALTYRPTAGLEALLRRAVAGRRLWAACLEEWRRTATPGDRARGEAALAAAGEVSPVSGYNRIRGALRRRADGA